MLNGCSGAVWGMTVAPARVYSILEQGVIVWVLDTTHLLMRNCRFSHLANCPALWLGVCNLHNHCPGTVQWVHPLLWQSATVHPIRDLHNPFAALSQQLLSGYANPSILVGCCNSPVLIDFSAVSFFRCFQKKKNSYSFSLWCPFPWKERRNHTGISIQIGVSNNFLSLSLLVFPVPLSHSWQKRQMINWQMSILWFHQESHVPVCTRAF